MYTRYKNNNNINQNTRYTETYKTNPFDKNEWGPKLWDVMHTFSFSYPINPTNNDKLAARNFFNSIGTLIPCKHCSQHCLEYTQRNQPRVNNKTELIDWVYNFHNAVNQRLGKQFYPKNMLMSKYENVAFCEV